MKNQDNDDALIEVNVFNFKGNDFFIALLPKSNYANDIISRVICVCVYAGWILIASARGCFYDTKINLQLIKLIKIKPVESRISFKSQKKCQFPLTTPTKPIHDYQELDFLCSHSIEHLNPAMIL